MNQHLANRWFFGVVATLFVAAALTQAWLGTPAFEPAQPGSVWMQPPDPSSHPSRADQQDADRTDGVASGPTLPPGPWDEKPETPEQPQIVASGPTLPPGPWDEKPETPEQPQIA